MAGPRRTRPPGDPGTKWVKESAVLKRVAVDVSDEWPCFVLNDAVVYDKDGHLANPLEVDLRGPFTVRGRLEVEEKEQQGFLVKPNVKRANIEIQASSSYSIGYGPYPVVWVSGQSGWFEINPAPCYAAMYDKIYQAITLYYKIMEAYEAVGGWKKRKNIRVFHQTMDLDEVFFKYAVAVGDGVVRAEVEQRCHDHAEFLLCHFPTEGAFIWENTSFYHWMVDQHPELHQKIVQAGQKQPAQTITQTGTGTQESSDGPEDANHTRRATRGLISDSPDTDVDMVGEAKLPLPAAGLRAASREKSKALVPNSPRTITPIPLPAYAAFAKSHAATSPASENASSSTRNQDHVTFLLEFLSTELWPEAPKNPEKVTLSSFQSRLHLRCKVTLYNLGKEIPLYFARQILDSLSEQWKRTPLYDALKRAASKPFTPSEGLVEKLPYFLVRRQQNARTVVKPEADDGQSLKSHGFQTPPLPGPRRSGKAAGLRLATSSKKRSASEMDDSPDIVRGKKPSKTARFSADEDDGLDHYSRAARSKLEDESDSEEDATDDGEEDGLEPVSVVIRAHKIPTMSPSGPNGTWTCEEQGCGYIVRSAEDKASQKLIEQHFKYHRSCAAQIELAIMEGNRGHNPVSHLLDRLKQLGNQVQSEQLEASMLNGRRLPPPIKRRLFP